MGSDDAVAIVGMHEAGATRANTYNEAEHASDLGDGHDLGQVNGRLWFAVDDAPELRTTLPDPTLCRP